MRSEADQLFFQMLDFRPRPVSSSSAPSPRSDRFFSVFLRNCKFMSRLPSFRIEGRYFVSAASQETRHEIVDENWIPHAHGDRSLYRISTKEKSETFVLMSQKIIDFFEMRAAEEEARVVREVTKFIDEAKEKGTKFKLMVVSGEYLEIDDNGLLPLPEHIRQFLPYEDSESSDYFSAIVTPERVTKRGAGSSLLFIELGILSVQRRSFEADEEADQPIALAKEWADLADCRDIRFPEVALNDGGVVNCYGAYSALFVPLDDFLAAKREFLQDKRRNSSHLPYLMQEKLLSQSRLPDTEEEEERDETADR